MQLPHARSADVVDDFPLSETGEELLFEAWEKAETPAKKIEFQRFESFQSFVDEAELLDDVDLTFVEDRGENPFKRRRHHAPKEEEESQALKDGNSDGDLLGADEDFIDSDELYNNIPGYHDDTEEDAEGIAVGEPTIKLEKEDQSIEEAEEEATAKEYKYPLEFKMIDFDKQASENGAPFKKPSFWSHNLFRGPNNERVKVHYCTTKADSERVAQRFLNEDVLGFDMEWRYPQVDGLKNNASLIQLASEKEIALFHIAVHPGDTLEELLAPSLTKIIESDKITKCGVCILTADGYRCREYLKMNPRGLFELSDLYWLTKYGNTEPHLITSKKKAMAAQVEEHLELPLWKGKVRTSNWSKRLNEEQIKYAAADAYAGFILFKVMDAKRESMDPTPPRPAFAELKKPIVLADGTLAGRSGYRKRSKSASKAEDKPSEEDATMKDAESAVDPTMPQNRPSQSDPTIQVINIISSQCAHETTTPQKGRRRNRTKRNDDLVNNLDETGKRIFEALRKNRAEAARKQAVSAYIIAHNTVLKDIANQRPTTSEALLCVRGIRKRTADAYGNAWLSIIRENLSEEGPTSAGTERSPGSADPQRFNYTPPSNGAKQPKSEFRIPPGVELPLEQPTPSKLPAPAPVPAQIVNPPTTLKRSKSSAHPAPPIAAPGLSENSAAPGPSMTPTVQVVSIPALPAEQALARQRRVRSVLNGIRIQLSRRTGLAPHVIATDAMLDTVSGIYPCTFSIVNAVEGGGKLLAIAREQGVDLLGVVAKCAPATSIMPELPADVSGGNGGEGDDENNKEEEAFARVDFKRQADRRRREMESVPRPQMRKWKV